MTEAEPTEAETTKAGRRSRKPADIGVRVLWGAIIVLALAVLFQVAQAVGSDRERVVAKAGPGEISVEEAIGLATRRPRAVRGFVVLRERFPPELCTGLMPGRPPRCLGPSMLIKGLDLARLDLEQGKDGDVEVSWTAKPVAILGQLDTATITVQEILN